MNKELVDKLQLLIARMKIPCYRKTIKNKDNVRWLSRNLVIENSTHPHFTEVTQIIKELK